MIKGGKVICTRSDITEFMGVEFFTEGKEYEIKDLGLTSSGHVGMQLLTDAGQLSPAVNMKGNFWDFEVMQ